MKILKAAFLALLIMLTACGYQVVGMGGIPKRTYYLEHVGNQSRDLTITEDINKHITRFFYDYGSLRPYDEAEYVLKITLIIMEVHSGQISSTREAQTVELQMTYRIVVENKQGRVMYDRNRRDTKTFRVGNDIMTYRKNLWDAQKEITDDILTEFKYAFEVTR